MTSAKAAGRAVLRPEAAVGWAAAAATVLVVYVLVVLGGGLLIGRTESPHLGLSVIATAVVAMVAEPVRARAERRAARRLHRPERSPYDVLAQFSHEVTGTDTVEQAPAVIARMLAQGTGVAWAQVWVLVNDRLTLMAAYPPDAGTEPEPPTLYDSEPRDGLRAVTVAHARQPLGVLRVQERDGHPLTPVEDRLFGGLAAQAGMVLRTAQLRAELAARLEQLTARELALRHVRDDLVTTQDLERRRLERDIHDGAQQQLVALAINLKLARTLAASDPHRAGEVLQEQRHAVSAAIATLTDLSSDLIPEELDRRGLVPALAAATVSNPVPVRVSGPEHGVIASAVAAALYYCALEAVQNATKHAEASRIDVHLREEPGRLELRVEDDGVGIGAATQRSNEGGRDEGGDEGSGLANMRDRIAALGGEVLVERGSAGGTTVVVGVPTPPPTATGTA